MPFDWMNADRRPRGGTRTRKSMYEQEVRSRAALLRRLGYTKADARRRCSESLAEEFASFAASPLLKKEVDALIAEVYA